MLGNYLSVLLLRHKVNYGGIIPFMSEQQLERVYWAVVKSPFLRKCTRN